MQKQNKYFGVADEGGFWPEFDSHEEILNAMMQCIELAGYTPGTDVAIALDVAASEFHDGTSYRFQLEDRSLDREELLILFKKWCTNFPIVSLEDPFSDRDPEGWSAIRAELGDRVQLIGDDLFTTNIELIDAGVKRGLANAVLIKLNQIGTLTETLAAIRLTRASNWRPVISARSGETEDAFISHLAVATDAGQIKVGSFSRSERMAKWNELLRIGRCLKEKPAFAGRRILEPL
jgi:enolase